ncbi:tetratricopeptide repeat protein [Shewanella gaetbuli]
MSVINKMLQDLEKRQQTEEGTEDKPEAEQFVRPQVEFTSQFRADEAFEQSRINYKKWLWLIPLTLIPAIWFGMSLLQEPEVIVETQQGNHAAKVHDVNEVTSISTLPDLQRETSEIDIVVKPIVEKEAVQTDTSNEVATAEVAETVEPEGADTETSSQQSDDSQLANNQLESSIKRAPIVEPEEGKSEVARAATESSTVNSQPNTGSMTVTEVKMSKEQLAQAQFTKAQMAENAGQLDNAAGLYLEAVLLKPDLHEARKQLAGIYLQQNNFNTAIRLLESGISLFPEHWEFYLLKANVEASFQEYDAALTSLSNMGNDSAFIKEKHILQAELAQKVGDYTLAVESYRMVLIYESTRGKWWLGLAYALDSEQQYVQATRAYRSALSYGGLSDSAVAFIEKRLAQLGEYQ